MEDIKVPLRDVLKVAFEFELDTDAELKFSQAIELVLKSKLSEKATAINRLLQRFGLSSTRFEAFTHSS